MISVVVVSFNTKDIIIHALECLFRSTYTNFEVIVVDNGSTDGSQMAIREKFLRVKLIQNTHNVGFAIANNQGMAATKGEFILLLNSDAFVFQDSLELMMKFMSENQKVSVVGPRLLNRDGILQQSYGYFPGFRRIIMMMFFLDSLPVIGSTLDSIHVRSESRYIKSIKVDWITGAVVLLKKEVLTKVGGFDERFFMYGEEVEWMYRISGAKFQIWFDAESKVVHLGGASSPNRNGAIILEMKSWLSWFDKYEPNALKTPLIITIMIGCFLRMIFKPKYREGYRLALSEFSRLLSE